MPKMIITMDDVLVREVKLTRERTSLGRRPYNDIVIDNLSVSGEHALIHIVGSEVFLEDLGSTNGTYVNGKTVKKHQLESGDVVEVAKYKIKFLADGVPDSFQKMVLGKPRPNLGATSAPNSVFPPNAADPPPVPLSFKGAIKVLSGSGAGREVQLTKAVTTLGKPGVAVAAITRRSSGYVVNHVEGAGKPKLNGVAVGSEPIAMKNGDELELAGTRMQYIQS